MAVQNALASGEPLSLLISTSTISNRSMTPMAPHRRSGAAAGRHVAEQTIKGQDITPAMRRGIRVVLPNTALRQALTWPITSAAP